MADNRLYIGNKRTGEWTYLTKSGIGKEYGWYNFEISEAAQNIIDADKGQFLGEKTELTLFTEYEEEYWDIELKLK